MHNELNVRYTSKLECLNPCVVSTTNRLLYVEQYMWVSYHTF